jgi:hypothetical protein
METNNAMAGKAAPADYTMRGADKKMTKRETQIAEIFEQYPELKGHRNEAEIIETLLKDYQPMRETHGIRREPVILLAPDYINLLVETGQSRALIEDNNAELRLDVLRAVRKFTVTERNVIFKVAVGGMSIEDACRSYKYRSVRTWQRWYFTEALPVLRTELKGYHENGKVVMA